MKPFNMIKLSTLAISLVFSTSAISADEGHHSTNNHWQSSLAAEFSKIDASGNGLLMPSEASKGKVFNKKTFAAADTDNDGTIDQTEYINYKTSMGATNNPGSASNSTVSASNSTVSDSSSANIAVKMPSTASNLDDDMGDRPTEMAQNNTETNNRSAGVVIDDSVITAKAKAAIFSTPDLKTLQISVETRKGEVTLTGVVDSDAAKKKVEQVVKNIEGVSAVMNSLEVKG